MTLKRGQAVMETAVLILIIVGVLAAMQVYLKRGIQGRMRGGIDSIGEQYDPQATSSSFNIDHQSSATTTTSIDTQERNVNPDYIDYGDGTYSGTPIMANVTTTDTTIETHYDDTTRTGYETVANP